MDANLNTQNRVSQTRAINVPNMSAGRDEMYAAERAGINELARAYANVSNAIAHCGKLLYQYDQDNVKKQYAADEAVLKQQYATQYAELSNRIAKQRFGSSDEMRAAFAAGAEEIDERIAAGIERGFENGDGSTFRFRNADRFQEQLRQLGEVQKAAALNDATEKWIVAEDNRTQKAFDTQMSTAVLLGDSEEVDRIHKQLVEFYPANKALYDAKRDYALQTIANKSATESGNRMIKLRQNAAEEELRLALAKDDFNAAKTALDKQVKLGTMLPAEAEARLEREGFVFVKKKKEAEAREAGKVKKAAEKLNKNARESVLKLAEKTDDYRMFQKGLRRMVDAGDMTFEEANNLALAFKTDLQEKKGKESYEVKKLALESAKKQGNIKEALETIGNMVNDGDISYGRGVYMTELAQIEIAEENAKKSLADHRVEEAKKEEIRKQITRLATKKAAAMAKLAELTDNAGLYEQSLKISVENGDIDEDTKKTAFELFETKIKLREARELAEQEKSEQVKIVRTIKAETGAAMKVAEAKKDRNMMIEALGERVSYGIYTKKQADSELDLFDTKMQEDNLKGAEKLQKKREGIARDRATILKNTRIESLEREMNKATIERFCGGNKNKVEELVAIEADEAELNRELEEARVSFEKQFYAGVEGSVADFENELKKIQNLSELDYTNHGAQFRNNLEQLKTNIWARFKAGIQAEQLNQSVLFKQQCVEMKYDKGAIMKYSAMPVFKNISPDDAFADSCFKFAKTKPSGQDATLLAAYLMLGKCDVDAPNFQQSVHRVLSNVRASGGGVEQGAYEQLFNFATTLMEKGGKAKLDAAQTQMVLTQLGGDLAEYFDVNKKKYNTVPKLWAAINDSELSGDACDVINNFIFSLPNLTSDQNQALMIGRSMIQTVYKKTEEEQANAAAQALLNNSSTMLRKQKGL